MSGIASKVFAAGAFLTSFIGANFDGDFGHRLVAASVGMLAAGILFREGQRDRG